MSRTDTRIAAFVNCALVLAILVGLAQAPPASAQQPRPATVGVRADADGESAGFALSEYQARRAKARETFAGGVVAIRGTAEAEATDSTRLKQNNWFLYLTGVRAPDALLLIDAQAPEGERETLYLPPRNPVMERWTGPKLGAGPEAAAAYGFERVRETTEFDRDLRSILERRGTEGSPIKIWTIVPTGADATFTRDAAFAGGLRATVAAARPGVAEVADATPKLSVLRRTKSAAEIAKLQRAIDITLAAQRAAAHDIGPGRFEYEVEGTIVGAFLRGGANGEGFPSIVGSGVNSTVLHYEQNLKRIEAGDLVVVDIGAELHGYTADVTRTWPASGRFTKRQREVYDLVLEAQTAAAAAWKPGMTIRALGEVARETMRRSPLRDRSGKTLDESFIHGLGHFLGMDVHDVGDYSIPLQPGDVFTIEPGIYLADEQLGVRIEDDYLVTEKGLVKLSGALPSSPDEIERLMRRR